MLNNVHVDNYILKILNKFWNDILHNETWEEEKFLSESLNKYIYSTA